jgi:phosphate transport system substrate-binding protein
MHTPNLARTVASILVVLGMTLSPLTAFAQGAPVTIGGPFEGEASALTGAGATCPAPLYQKWFDEYSKVAHVNITYQAIGSGGGIKGIQDQTVDFGASDAPMTDEQLQAAKGGQLFHIPTALGAIVPTYNVPEATSVQLNFTPDSLSAIYLGDIQSWNDPRLVADNPVLANVDQPIVVVHRSDGSGTTFGFTDYLSSVSSDWLSMVGKGTSVNWPVGLGASGNPGVAGEVQQDPYAIGYVELIYAIQNNLGYGTVQNSSGTFINPSLDSVTAAASAAAGSIPADLRFSIVNSSGPDAYPISTATWLLAYRDVSDRAKGLALTRMLWWATHEGQRFNNVLAYATVPAAITARSEGFIRQIAVQGTPIFPNR